MDSGARRLRGKNSVRRRAALLDRGVVMVLEYRGVDGKPIGTVSIDRDTRTALK